MSHTVLVCDDAIFMRTMISDILTQAGFEVVGEAETGVQAVEKYRELKPDLVTMDIVMPDMGGIEAVREICQERSRRQDPDVQRHGPAGAGGRGDPGRRQGLRGQAVPAIPGARGGAARPRLSAMDLAKYAALFLAESREHLTSLQPAAARVGAGPGGDGAGGGAVPGHPLAQGHGGHHGLRAGWPTWRTAPRTCSTRSAAGGRRPEPEYVDLLFRAVDALEDGVDEAAAGADGRSTGRLAGGARGGGCRAARRAPAKRRRPAGRRSRPSRPPVAASRAAPARGLRGGGGARGARRDPAGRAAPRGAGARSRCGGRRQLGHGHRRHAAGAPTSSARTSTAGSPSASRTGAASQIVAAIEAAARSPASAWTPTPSRPPNGGSRRRPCPRRRRRRPAAGRSGWTAGAARRADEARSANWWSRATGCWSCAQLDPGGELEALGARISRLVSRPAGGDARSADDAGVAGVRPLSPRGARPGARTSASRSGSRWKGEDIELDRAMLDELGDPLLHLLRNAVDHGIEPPDERRASGQAGRGTPACCRPPRERSSVAIRVQDDGRGIDRAPILAKAKREGVVGARGRDPDATTCCCRCSARPGFSTAERGEQRVGPRRRDRRGADAGAGARRGGGDREHAGRRAPRSPCGCR